MAFDANGKSVEPATPEKVIESALTIEAAWLKFAERMDYAYPDQWEGPALSEYIHMTIAVAVIVHDALDLVYPGRESSSWRPEFIAYWDKDEER